MIRPILYCASLLIAAAPVAATSFASSAGSAASDSTAGTSGSTSGNDKVIVQARDDAAGFVASDGRIRGARLEAALRQLRERDASARTASDMQLAQAILAL